MRQLRQLGISGLSVDYAEVVAPGKVKHYRSSIARHMLSSKEELRERLKTTIGEDFEIVYPQPEVQGLGALQVNDLKGSVKSKVNRILRKKSIRATLYQYLAPSPGLKNLIKFQAFQLMMKLPLHHRFKIPQKVRDYLDQGISRRICPCRYFSIHTTEKNIPKAIAILEQIVLDNKDTIMGALSPISSITLSDTVGDGQKRFAVFMFIFLKLDDQYFDGSGPKKMVKLPYETEEGGIEDPIGLAELPEIEVVHVADAGNSTIGVSFPVRTNYTTEFEIAEKERQFREETSEVIDDLEAAIEAGGVEMHADGVFINE